MVIPDDFVFSQSALQDYHECPRRFELKYILQAQWPALETQQALEHEAGLLKGQEFHHLVHQHTLGVTADAIKSTINDDDLLDWWKRYFQWQSENLPERRFPELTLTVPIGGSLLMAKYDLVTKLDDSTFLIIDWKTGRPQKMPYLAGRMQTKVYPYVLHKAGDWLNGGKSIQPESIKMIYWFSQIGESVEFKLNEEKLREDEQFIESVIGEIAVRHEFPLTDSIATCRFCIYRSLCERGVEAGRLDELEDADSEPGSLSLDLDELEEISF